MSSIRDLNQQFALDGSLSFAEHASGLLIGTVKTTQCSAQFFLQGAHVTHFQPSHTVEPILFMSQEAIFEPSRPIRGGIPICFPWFSAHPTDPSLPAHGWARILPWQVSSARQTQTTVEVTLTLNQDSWQLTYQLQFGATLQACLAVTNKASTLRTFEVALHTYFQIGAIEQTKISGGLSELPYYDQLDASTHPPQAEAIYFQAETDRIYHGSATKIHLHDQANERIIDLSSSHSQSTIVWNPWIAKSKRMSDFGDQEYLRMCCIETANVRNNQISIQPFESHRTSLEISVCRTA
jgi:glucose-6-phosphate 1-epimerase